MKKYQKNPNRCYLTFTNVNNGMSYIYQQNENPFVYYQRINTKFNNGLSSIGKIPMNCQLILSTDYILYLSTERGSVSILPTD